MSARLPGSAHSKSPDPDERKILWAIAHSPVVRKLEAMGLRDTGSTRHRRLVLALSRRAGVVKVQIEGVLFIGGYKRWMTVTPEAGVEVDKLGECLTKILKRYAVVVDVRGGNAMEHMEAPVGNGLGLTLEKAWSYCEAIGAAVTTVKEFEQQEELLEMQLEDVRKEKRTVQEQAIATFFQVLKLGPGGCFPS